jgi:alkanesulfonate monooxygenase SsuD/methylene tetrahydromethanopterin reductase-like flavin-dependent oxidoreductase (luciferase family)
MARLAEELGQVGRTPESFPVAIATTWLYVTDDNGAAERAPSNVLAPMLQRPVEALRSAPLLIGPAKLCAERLAAFVDAGVRRIFVWPLGDERRQLELFRERVTCLLPGQPCTATRRVGPGMRDGVGALTHLQCRPEVWVKQLSCS